jgi:hypothetical protein
LIRWFSRSSTKKKSSRSSSKRKRASKPWDPQRTLLALKIVGVVALAVVVVIGWVRSEQVLGRYTSLARSAAVERASVTLVDAPQWMDPGLHDRLRGLVAAEVGPDPLDRTGLAQAVDQLDADPWVAAVHQVRRSPHGIVRVEADYRQPAAWLAKSDGYHIIDRAGVWLDGPINRAASPWRRLPLITGVSADPPASYGQVWRGQDFDAALKLEALLSRQPYADQIVAYDVSHRNLMGQLWLVLYTNGPTIVWGLPPGDEKTVEPEAPIKLGALQDWAYSHRGRIDRGANTVWVYTGTAQIDARPTANQASSR